ncbi:hypothetical protein NE237_030951 [Protea cynaroides]|uniref:Uncharacterized protein n=1 Tax=Protea cynaroides TaxID=273540 RepID=A0A9Q0GV33_9MAGN|nr:hypothetical protein NE237_030951 [Protea cynaroides]
MADGTRARQMDIRMEKISAQIANLQQQLREEIKSLVLPLQVQLDKLSEDFEASKAISRDQDDASQFSGSTSNQIAISAASRLFRVKFPRLPSKRLTIAEIQQKREKGLCFNCDEKFHIGHKCKNQTSLLQLEGEENEEQINSTISDEIEAEEEEFSPAISLHALIGQASPKTLRLQGVIDHHKMQTLVDSGSTHNFIEERTAKFLGLTITPSMHFRVQVGNGKFHYV